MRAGLILAACAAVALAGCQTANVTLLNDEGGGVGKVAVLDAKTGAEVGEVTAADTEARTGGKRVKPRKARNLFAGLFGFMPQKEATGVLEFKVGTTEITDESKPELAKLLNLWQRDRTVSDIRIIGYADSTGDPAGNLRLSQDRANAVRDFLANQGFEFNADNSEVVGRGDIDALAKNGPGVADDKYRKVTVEIR